jgi:hypothetical protein
MAEGPGSPGSVTAKFKAGALRRMGSNPGKTGEDRLSIKMYHIRSGAYLFRCTVFL